MSEGRRWSKDELKLAFNLYCQLPFGKLHSKNPEIVELAGLIDRTPSSVAMKLVNFASLDPAITSTGRSGLGNASQADREVWNEFHASWSKLAAQSDELLSGLRGSKASAKRPEAELPEDFYGATVLATVEARLNQSFFRRAVLANYQGKCCMSGITVAPLLVASHIVPWNVDPRNRLNPRNGLCLSALHDRAFDRGLITVNAELKVEVSATLKKHRDEAFINASLLEIEGRKIDLPEKFTPDIDFLRRHKKEVFLGG